MGNSKSKSVQQIGDDVMNNKSKSASDFNSLPHFQLPTFLKEHKNNIESMKNNAFDPVQLITLMNEVILQRDHGEQNSGASSSVWASGIGFGGGDMDSVAAKQKRDILLKEATERESILIHAFNLFVKNIDTSSIRALKQTRRLFRKSEIKQELVGYLTNDSMLDITNHGTFYWYSWKFLLTLASTPELRALIFNGRLYSHMQKLINVAESYKERAHKISKSTAPGIGLVDAIINSKKHLEKQYESYNPIRKLKSKEPKKESKKRETVSVNVKNEIAVEVKEEKKSELPDKPKPKRKKRRSKSKEESEYVTSMKPLVFDCATFKTHKYHPNALSKDAMNRIMLELQSLADSLPSCLTTTSSIYLRTDEQNLDRMKCLIIGPDETPYSLGCFEFDIQIPSNYPSSPPKVQIITTGNDSFRFNPNLYANGKVCLSLIGTWSGAPEEKWDPLVSTLLQVFISIQSLILVANPYYNEPGYQFRANDQANIDYNNRIQEGTTRLAILGQLKNTHSVFQDVIKTHCKFKKDEILQQCKDWNISQHMIDELTAELEKL